MSLSFTCLSLISICFTRGCLIVFIYYWCEINTHALHLQPIIYHYADGDDACKWFGHYNVDSVLRAYTICITHLDCATVFPPVCAPFSSICKLSLLLYTVSCTWNRVKFSTSPFITLLSVSQTGNRHCCWNSLNLDSKIAWDSYFLKNELNANKVTLAPKRKEENLKVYYDFYCRLVYLQLLSRLCPRT